MNPISLDIENTHPDPVSYSEDESFCKDVMEGLSASPKFLQSKYFYDAAGDSIFQEIMDCEEYYPFGCEMEIFREQTNDLAEAILLENTPFELIELGAGDCSKSKHLLKHLVTINADFIYRPIDISDNIIDFLHLELPLVVPGIKVHGVKGDYFKMMERASQLSGNRKVVLFLGSNLGNMPPKEASAFCKTLRSYLRLGDTAIIGLDLKKHPEIILAAYNDKGGITKRFNLNLLERINRELGGDFDTQEFAHYPVYDPQTGSCKSFLISLKDQQATLKTKDGPRHIRFKENEEIYMEVSQKYTIEQISSLAYQASFQQTKMFYDKRKWFVNAVWKAI